MATERPDARLTAEEAADAAVFVDSNTTDLTTILGEFTTYPKAAAVLADNAIVRGDGGVRGQQDSGVLIDDSDNITAVNELTIENGANDAMALFNTIANKISTGVQDGGGLLTVNGGDNELFDISDGVGYVVDNYTDASAPVPTRVTWSGETGLTATYRATDGVSFVGINAAGTVVQQNSVFTSAQRRTIIVLGVLNHPGTTITSTSDRSKNFESSHLAYDHAESIGVINESGNNFNPAGTDLTVRKESGVSFGPNLNRATAANDPHHRTSGVENPVTAIYVYDDGSGDITPVPGQTDLDPDQYDDGSGTLAAVGSGNKWTNIICYHFPSPNVQIFRYGTEIFTSLISAKNAAFDVPSTIGSGLDNDLIRTVISIKQGETDNSSADTFFSVTGKFGLGASTSGGGSGGSVQDLQDVYESSVPDPEIETNAVQGAVGFKEGQGDNTLDVIEVQNGAGTQTAAITGDGCVKATQIFLEHTSVADDDHAIEIVAHADGHGDVKALDIDYETGAIGVGDAEGVILENIDESASTGGHIYGLEVLATAEGSATVDALKVGVQVNPLSHDAGTFGNMDSLLVNAVDELTDLSSGGAGNVDVLVADNDTITIGDAAMFEELEIILDTGGSHNAQLTFEFSTGVGTWTAFTPTDGTNGFQNTGLILWDDADIPTWAVGTGSEYLIRITRTRNSLPTNPIADLVQISAVTLYGWDKNADLTINGVETVTIELGHASDTTLSRSSAGVLAVEGDVVPTVGKANEFTAAQNFNETALTPAATVAWDLEANQVCTLAIDQNSAMGTPTNLVAGSSGWITITQDSTPRTLTWPSTYHFIGGTDPVLSTGSGDVDTVFYKVSGAVLDCTFAQASA